MYVEKLIILNGVRALQYTVNAVDACEVLIGYITYKYTFVYKIYYVPRLSMEWLRFVRGLLNLFSEDLLPLSI